MNNFLTMEQRLEEGKVISFEQCIFTNKQRKAVKFMAAKKRALLLKAQKRTLDML